MKKALQMLGLATFVLLTSLSTAGAGIGDCHIECTYGGSHHGPVPREYASCCDYFGSLCGYYGTAYEEVGPPINEMYCPSMVEM